MKFFKAGDELIDGKYTVIKFLGGGGQGDVYMVQKQTGENRNQLFAAKVEEMKFGKPSSIKTEFDLYQKL